jgi:DMSO/TMAO reductase YedYZ molybdopterin-dependent catalytic subunit
VVAAASGLGVLSRLVAGGRPGTPGPTAAPLPSPAVPAPTLAPDASLPVAGITPLVTPNDAFFQVDTAFIDPTVDLATWRLRVTGMVERELDYSYDDLLALPLAEVWATLACVSNEVGGDLVGNARWTGAPLTLLLESAGVLPGATQVVGRSVDGFTAGFPTAWALDPARKPLVALGMNGSVLPVEHGFPARLVVPGLYGYVSATKWLAEIELTTLEAFDAYWVPRGWAKEAPILTQSRIDVPGDGARVAAGAVDVAGVAWAPDRGVSRVEARVDGGSWLPAELSRQVAPASWLQWRLRWQAEPGEHTIEVRATDGLGIVQAEERTPPAPDGARGYHRVRVRVD